RRVVAVIEIVGNLRFSADRSGKASGIDQWIAVAKATHHHGAGQIFVDDSVAVADRGNAHFLGFHEPRNVLLELAKDEKASEAVVVLTIWVRNQDQIQGLLITPMFAACLGLDLVFEVQRLADAVSVTEVFDADPAKRLRLAAQNMSFLVEQDSTKRLHLLN